MSQSRTPVGVPANAAGAAPAAASRVARGVPTGGQFATSTRAEAGLGLDEPPAMRPPLVLADVKVSPDGTVKTRAGGTGLGQVPVVTDPDGKKRWVAVVDGQTLTYQTTGHERTYLTRAHAVQAVLNRHNGTDDPARWAGAPAVNWTTGSVDYWGYRHQIADVVDKPLLHGSPHLLEPGDVLMSDVAPVNFKQSDPFAVSLTTELRAATGWARDASNTGTFYVYEVEPLTDVDPWRFRMEGIYEDPARGKVGHPVPNGAALVLDEGRVGAARIVTRHEYTRGPT